MLALTQYSRYARSMKSRSGFTVVEIILVIAILAMLMVLGTVAFRNFQSAARDKEREADIQAFVTYMESLYPQEISEGGTVIKSAGSYLPLPVSTTPSGDVMQDAQFAKAMDKLADSAMIFPGSSRTKFRGAGTEWKYDTHKYAWRIANWQLTAGELNDGNGKPLRYAYVPINQAGYRCAMGEMPCRAFKVFYTLESSPNTVRIVDGKRR